MADIPFLGEVSWDKFWRTLVQTLNESIDIIIDAAAPALSSLVPLVVGFVVQTFISFVANAGRAIGEAVDEYEQDTGMQILEMAASALSDFFGTSVSTATIGLRGGTGGRREVSDQLGRLVLREMFSAMSTTGELTPERGKEAAERLVGYSMSNAIEGWLGQVLTLPFVNKWIPSWGDLDEVVARNMGVGAASSRAMSPILDATVSIPFRWHVYKQFTPSILSSNEAVKAWIQGSITEDEYFEIQSRHGFDREHAATLKLLKGRFPFKYDIERMQRLGMFSAEEMVAMLRKRGFLPEVAELLAEMYGRLGEDTANKRSATVAADMFADQEISEEEFRSIMEDLGYTPEEIDARIGLGLLERSRPRRLPRSVLEKAFRTGVVSDDRLRDYYVSLGYTEADVGVLMELQLADVEEAPKVLPQASMERAFVHGHITRGRYEEYLRASGLEAEAVAIAMDLAEEKRKAFEEKATGESSPFGLN